MFKKILVPLDGSALAAAALLPATTLARRDHAELILVGAASPSNVAEMGVYLTAMAGYLSAEGLTARAMFPLGAPENEISEEAELARADLIVMTTHGRAGMDGLLHSSFTWEVLARTGAPILVIRYADEEQAAPSVHQLSFVTDATAPILVPLDGSLQAESVLPLARELAEAFGNPLVLVRAGNPLLLAEGAGAQDLAPGGSVGWWMEEAKTYLMEKQAELMRTGLSVTSVAALGMPAALIQTLAQEHHAGLILMTSPARGWLGRLLLGSVARNVLSQSEIPVLLVRRGASVSVEETRVGQTLVEASVR